MKYRPTDYSDSELDGLLSRLVDEELTMEEQERLAEILRADRAAREYYFHYLSLHSALHWDYAEAARDLPGTELDLREPHPSRAPGLSVLAIAALVCTVLFFILVRSEKTIVEVEFAEDAVSGGESLQLIETGKRLAAGTVYVESATGSAQLRFDDGTVIIVEGESELTFSAPKAGKSLQLRRGRLTADVASQPPGAPLMIRTPTAEIEVVGTVLSLSADSLETGLAVAEGLVRLKRLADGKNIEVPANHRAVASLDPRSNLFPGEALAPPVDWQLEVDDSRVRVTRGVPSGQIFVAEPYVAKRNEDGSKVVRHGVAINGQLARLTPESRINVRYRSEATPSLFIVRAKLDGRFGGNYEARIPDEEITPDRDGWREASLKLHSFRKLPHSTGSDAALETGEIRKILVSVQSSYDLEVTEVSISGSDRSH